jgi:AcrR family transcriptional regulator
MSGELPGAATAGRRGGGRPAHRDGERSTRDEILGAARDCFGERGYDRATIRDIAARASVDPALVLHYFGSKEQLFAAALEVPLDPSAIIRRVMAHDRGEMGASLVRAFLEAWEPEETRSPLLAMVRSAMTNETAMELVREFLGRRIFTPLTATLGVADADLRATLIGSQLIGMAMVRYIARIEPLASAPVERIVSAAAPTVQRYLTGDLGAVSPGSR